MAMRLLVITPHFEPDTAPTGIIVTSLVEQWAKQGHQIEVITSLPWYEKHEIENHWKGRLFRREEKESVTITRLHPFPQDKNKLFRIKQYSCHIKNCFSYKVSMLFLYKLVFTR